MDHPQGATGISRSGKARRWPAAGSGSEGCASRASWRSMSPVDTDGATREASGAHPYGRYFEEFEVGAIYKHWPAKTVTEADDHLFCLLTMNHHPLHINDVYAAQSQQGKNVVVGPYVYSLALGMSVSDITGKAIANLATQELSHPAPSSTATRSTPRQKSWKTRNPGASPTAAPSSSTRGS